MTNPTQRARLSALTIGLMLQALPGVSSPKASAEAPSGAHGHADPRLDRARAPARGLATDDDDAVEQGALGELDRFVNAVEERVRVLKETSPEERKKAAEKAAREMIAKAKHNVHAAKRRIAALETAAGSKAERAKERALRFLDELLGRLDRAESLL